MNTLRNEANAKLGLLNLKLEKNLTLEQIRKQYLKLAKIHHPDVSKQNDNSMKSINQAYEWLKENFSRIKKFLIDENKSLLYEHMFIVSQKETIDEKIKKEVLY